MSDRDKEVMPFSDRLRWIMDRYKLTITDAAAKCNIPSSTFNRYLSYDSVPTLDNLDKIIKAFPDIAIEWIVTGIGEPFKQADGALLETKYTAAGEVVSYFGKQKHPEFNSFTFNNGISISAAMNSDIRAVYEGEAIFADKFKGYGNMVIIDHGGGYFTLYAHASKITKKLS